MKVVKRRAFPESLDTIYLRQSLLDLVHDQHTKHNENNTKIENDTGIGFEQEKM
jgi:hypothetical protein